MTFEDIFGVSFTELFQGLPIGATTVVLAIIFLAVFFAVFAIASMVGNRNPVGHRLAPSGDANQDLAAPSIRKDADTSIWSQMLNKIERNSLPGDGKVQSSLRLRLYQAGFTSPSSVLIHYVFRLFCALGAPLAFILSVPTIAPDMEVRKIIIYTAVCAFIGIFLPRIWVSHRIDQRKLQYTEAFPDALDMLVVCVEAGLGLDAAITRVGEKISRAHPLLAEQFAMVALELRAGKSRADALRNMAQRVDIDELNSFVTLLIQSDQLGTSVAQTLRVYAEEMRVKRMLKAEEMAHKLPVKLVVPLVTCVLPAMITVVLLPAMIRIIRDVLPNLGN